MDNINLQGFVSESKDEIILLPNKKEEGILLTFYLLNSNQFQKDLELEMEKVDH